MLGKLLVLVYCSLRGHHQFFSLYKSWPYLLSPYAVSNPKGFRVKATNTTHTLNLVMYYTKLPEASYTNNLLASYPHSMVPNYHITFGAIYYFNCHCVLLQVDKNHILLGMHPIFSGGIYLWLPSSELRNRNSCNTQLIAHQQLDT